MFLAIDSYSSDLIVNEAETVYDYCWYPYMSSSGRLTAMLNCNYGGNNPYICFDISELMGPICFAHAPDPATCVFISTTRDHPIHLWDAVSGQVPTR